MADEILSPSKTCNRCELSLPLAGFSKHKSGKFGVRSQCKQCSAQINRKWREETPNWHSEWRARMTPDQRERERERDEQRARSGQKRAYYERAKPNLIAYGLAYAKRNPEIYAARAMHRIALKAKATPRWVDIEEIESIYADAAERTRLTGVKWHVDHIVPLNSPIVCGLHVTDNLAVIPASENISKSNRYWPDMP